MTAHNDSATDFVEGLTITECRKISNDILGSHDQRTRFNSIIDELLVLHSAFTDDVPWAIHFDAIAPGGTSQTITLPRGYVLAEMHLLLEILNARIADKFEVDRDSELICTNHDGTSTSVRWGDVRRLLKALFNDGHPVSLVFVVLKTKTR
jgi:hypothetical protein